MHFVQQRKRKENCKKNWMWAWVAGWTFLTWAKICTRLQIYILKLKKLIHAMLVYKHFLPNFFCTIKKVFYSFVFHWRFYKSWNINASFTSKEVIIHFVNKVSLPKHLADGKKKNAVVILQFILSWQCEV